MNTMGKFAAAGLVGAVSLTAAAPAQSAFICAAGTCTDTITYGPSATEIVGKTVLFPLFDSNVGILTGATVTFTATAQVKAGSTLTNTSATPQSFKVKQEVFFTITDLTSPGGALDLAVQALTLIPTTGLQSFTSVPGTVSAPANTISFGPFTNTGVDNLAAALTALKAPGGGNHTLQIDTSTFTGFQGGGGNISANFLTDGSLNIALTYNYESYGVPEPMSMAVLGLGLVGLGAARYSRKRKDAQEN